MTFCTFHDTFAVKTCIILKINILSAILGELLVTVTIIMAENDTYRFPEEDLTRGAHIGAPFVCR